MTFLGEADRVEGGLGAEKSPNLTAPKLGRAIFSLERSSISGRSASLAENRPLSGDVAREPLREVGPELCARLV